MKRNARRQTLKGILVLVGTAVAVALVAANWDAVTGLLSDPPGKVKVRGGKGKRAVKVITQAVTLTPDDRVFEAIGTGRASLSAEIHPLVSERVVEVRFQGGEQVTKGDPLVLLDAREERLAVRLARATLTDARARLADLEGATNKGAVARVELERAKLAAKTAQIELERAQLTLSERVVRAPFDGLVGAPLVDPGDRVTPETRITTVDDRQVMFVDFDVPEALAGELLRGEQHTVEATTPAWPARRFEGTVRVRESRVDADQRTLTATARVVNEGDALRPGMSFVVRWATGGVERPTVPEIALQWGREGAYVWVVRDGAAAQVKVRIVSRVAGQIMVEGSLTAGEAVVVEGLQRLRAGSEVEVLGTRS